MIRGCETASSYIDSGSAGYGSDSGRIGHCETGRFRWSCQARRNDVWRYRQYFPLLQAGRFRGCRAQIRISDARNVVSTGGVWRGPLGLPEPRRLPVPRSGPASSNAVSGQCPSRRQSAQDPRSSFRGEGLMGHNGCCVERADEHLEPICCSQRSSESRSKLSNHVDHVWTLLIRGEAVFERAKTLPSCASRRPT